MKPTAAALLLLMLPAAYACRNCSKTISCQGYEASVADNWFPYSTASVLTFAGGGASRSFTLNAPQLSEPYELKRSFPNGASGCTASKEISSAQRTAQGIPELVISLQQSRTDNGPINQQTAYVTIGGSAVALVGISDTAALYARFDSDLPVVTRYLPSVTLNGRSFTNTVEAARDTATNKSGGVYKLYVKPGIGVVGWADYPSGTLWALQ